MKALPGINICTSPGEVEAVFLANFIYPTEPILIDYYPHVLRKNLGSAIELN